MRFFGFIFLVFQCFSALHSQEQLVELKANENNPGNLRFFIHSPVKQPQTKRKIIVVLHGCNQDPKAIARISGWNELADEHQFWVLYPMQRAMNNFNQCYNWFDTKEVTKDQGEVGSIYSMLKRVVDSIQIDSTEIYVYGLSAGAGMAVALMACYPTTFKSGAVIGGTAYLAATNALEGLEVMLNPPSKTAEELKRNIAEQHQNQLTSFPNLVLFHSQNDPIVNVENAHQLIAQWASILQMDTIPDSVENQFQGHSDLNKYTYQNSLKTPKITFYNALKTGHCIWVDPGNGKFQGGKTGAFSKDKDFFSTYWIALDLGIINQ